VQSQFVPNGTDVEQRGVRSRINKDVEVTTFNICSQSDRAKNACIPSVVRDHHPADGVAMAL
jgi:hypothetical protein